MNHARLVIPFPNSQATKRLICFPYNGSEHSNLASWANSLSADIELVVVQWEHEGSWNNDESWQTDKSLQDESGINGIKQLISGLFPQLQCLLNKPYFIFGHGLGAIIAFETVKYLQKCQLRMPGNLLVSGRCAPHLVSRKEKPVSHLNDEELFESLLKYSAVPPRLQKSPDKLKRAMPQLRGDFSLIESYQLSTTTPLNCPIVALGGETDPFLSPKELAEWQEHTLSHFAMYIFPGNHFYLHQVEQKLLNLIEKIIMEYTHYESMIA